MLEGAPRVQSSVLTSKEGTEVSVHVCACACACVCVCVRGGGLSAHSVYINVDCCCNVQASLFFLPKPGWMTVRRLRYTIFGSRDVLPCKLSGLNSLE